jgi:hypothetical protein
MPSISDPAASLQSAIDAAVLEAMQSASGDDVLKSAIKSYLAAADELHAKLEDALIDARWQDAERLARSIAGLARDMGFLALSTAARGLVDAAQDEGDQHHLRNEAQMVIIEHERLRLQLAGVCPDLVA